MNIIIGCADDRFKGTEFITSIKKELNLKGVPIIIYWPGSIHDFINGSQEIQKHFQKRLFQVIDKKEKNALCLKIKIVIMQHGGGCVIYKEEYNFNSPDKEQEQQIEDMKRVKAILNKKYPHLKEIILLYTTKIRRQFQYERIS